MNFSLPDHTGKTWTLSDIPTSKTLIYVYPKDNTPGCTNQAVGFTELKNEYLAKDITIVGVSPDTQESHKKFIEDQSLDILLLSDTEKKLIEDLGAWGEKKNYGKTYIGLIRSTFLVDTKTGDMLKEWRNVRAKGHAQKILKEV